MGCIVGILAALTWMVASLPVQADDVRERDLEFAAHSQPIRFTPEQHELAGEVLDALGWSLWETLQEFRIVVNFAEPVDDANAEMVLEANMDEFRRMLKPELLFLRKACELSESEFQPIDQSADACLREVTRQFLEEQQSDSSEQTSSNTEPRTLPQRLQDLVAQVAECQLSAEQWGRYSHELRKRSEHRMRVAILNLVARLDADLRLSPNQRDQFAKLLEDNWDAAWGQSLLSFTDETNYMPKLPEEAVARILTPTQRVAMTDLQYENTNLWSDNPVDWFFDVEAEALLDAEQLSEDGSSPEDSAHEPRP